MGQSYFQLITPLIFLVFSCGFMVLRHYSRDRVVLPWFAASYFLGACAFVGDFLRDSIGPDVAFLPIYILHLATFVTFCAGLFAFYRGRSEWKRLSAIAAGTFVLVVWLHYGLANMHLRLWGMNGGVALLAAFTVFSLRSEMQRRIDRFLQIALLASTSLLLVRTAIVLWYDPGLTDMSYAGSVAAISLHFLLAIAALVLAGILFVIFGMDIVIRLTETSHTDPLTGVLNRRGMDVRVSALGGGTGHAVVLADIDRFKTVNDRYGHEAGDRVITRFARILTRIAREDDLVVRWGGEEFMVVMPGADVALARLYAESVRAAFETLRHECLDGDVVTASFGVAVWPDARPMADAARLADRALYNAKSNGRNRVCVDGAERPGRGFRDAVA